MTSDQWKYFCDFKDQFKNKVEEWKKAAPELTELQRQAALLAKTPEYPFETTVVYNRALDDITPEDQIKLIVIGDNPGKDEQLAKNNRYLVGQAGKIAEGYFRKNPELGVDFRKNVIILNKTPIHSAKTAQLNTIAKQGGEKIAGLIKESQLWMAEKTAQLHAALGTELWLVGYSELKPRRIFCPYRDELKAFCSPEAWARVYVFQHFSMNRFTIDLGDFIEAGKKEKAPLESNIHELGLIHKKEIFG
ncbi:hypothetical protein [Treponema bryantii]|uniref:hypothetical protein n=1 Tax=Treponema bryantii TaxID=163 RepID=UPI0003B5F5BD|nr:hypothetical protein [Treponema bryantii]